MRKLLKVSLILSGALLVLGITFVAAGKLLGGSFNFGVYINENGVGEYSGQIIDKTEVLEAFDRIETDTHSFDVYIQPGDEYKVEYHIIEENVPSIKVENNTLYVSQKNIGNISFFTTTVSEPQYMYITVPKDNTKVYDVDLLLTSDRMDIKEVNIEGSIEMTSGDLFINDLDSNDLNIKMSSGKAKINDINANDINIKMTSGSTVINNLKGKNIELTMSSGDVDMDNVEADSINTKQSSGNIKGNNINIPVFKQKMSSGTVEWNIIGHKDDYNWNLNKTSGSIKIDNDSIDKYNVDNKTDKDFEAELTSGSLKISFIDEAEEN